MHVCMSSHPYMPSFQFVGKCTTLRLLGIVILCIIVHEKVIEYIQSHALQCRVFGTSIYCDL